MTKQDDLQWMRLALEYSKRCPPNSAAFNVGAVVVASGQLLAFGYSRESDEFIHAEESALSKLSGKSLRGATIYSTMEPCSKRSSRSRTCTELILDTGISRVVYALREPPIFVHCEGVEILLAAGLQVTQLPDFAAAVAEVNSHLIS